jgi:hypothetical protein
MHCVACEGAAGTTFDPAIVEQHQRALEVALGVRTDPAQWRVDFVLALRRHLVTRLRRATRRHTGSDHPC